MAPSDENATGSTHKFWSTQPVIRSESHDLPETNDGPIKEIDPAQVSKEPYSLVTGFEWSTIDLEDPKQSEELHELLANHYIEDVNAMFRLNYSVSFFDWALRGPGWKKNFHVGVRATKSGKLAACICAIPAELVVRGKKLRSVEINFLCIHKKLRSMRLAPVLIKEITRRAYLDGIFQAVYTVGYVIPTPISACRYYHRSLNWAKLYDVGFAFLPLGSTRERQIIKNYVPSRTETPGLRPIEAKDVPAVQDLLMRYLSRFDIHQSFSVEEVGHYIAHQPKGQKIVWAYVVEDPETHKITDFASFHCLESSVIGNSRHSNIKAAYLYYYASEAAFGPDEKAYEERLTTLIQEMLVLAKKENFDVFNTVTLHDNPLFLEKLKFGAGDGKLYYYLFNYKTAPIAGGLDDKNDLDKTKRGGVGMILV